MVFFERNFFVDIEHLVLPSSGDSNPCSNGHCIPMKTLPLAYQDKLIVSLLAIMQLYVFFICFLPIEHSTYPFIVSQLLQLKKVCCTISSLSQYIYLSFSDFPMLCVYLEASMPCQELSHVEGIFLKLHFLHFSIFRISFLVNCVTNVSFFLFCRTPIFTF